MYYRDATVVANITRKVCEDSEEDIPDVVLELIIAFVGFLDLCQLGYPLCAYKEELRVRRCLGSPPSKRRRLF